MKCNHSKLIAVGHAINCYRCFAPIFSWGVISFSTPRAHELDAETLAQRKKAITIQEFNLVN